MRTVEGGIYITVKDLMKITGSNNYNSCGNLHRTIRDSIAKNKKKLTVKEYCDYEKVDFEYVWNFLRNTNDKTHKKP
jgi:predicted chitinase